MERALGFDRQSSLFRVWRSLHTHEGRTIFALALISGLFTAGYKATDNLMMHHYITASDDLTAASTYLLVGAWVGVFTRVAYNAFFGRRFIDHTYRGVLRGSARMHKLAFIAGAISALGTLATLRGNQGADPGVMIALSSFQVAFMFRFDRRKGQSTDGIMPLVLLTLVGCAMASYKGSWNFPWLPMVLVLLVSSPINGYGSHLSQEGSREEDSIIFMFYRFVWLAVVGTVGVVLLAQVRGKLGLLGHTFHEAITSWAVWIVVLLTMLFVFFSDTLETRAKKEGGASLTYVFVVIASVQILLGIPITLIGEAVSKGVFGGIPHGVAVWSIRIIGVGLVALCIFHLREKRAAALES